MNCSRNCVFVRFYYCNCLLFFFFSTSQAGTTWLLHLMSHMNTFQHFLIFFVMVNEFRFVVFFFCLLFFFLVVVFITLSKCVSDTSFFFVLGYCIFFCFNFSFFLETNESFDIENRAAVIFFDTKCVWTLITEKQTNFHFQ